MSEFCPWLLTHRGPAKEEKEGYFYGECDIISHLHHTNCFLCEVAQSCPTLCDPMDCCLPGFSVHGIFQASTGVGCHFLLKGIFPTQGSNLGLPHCRQTIYPLSHQFLVRYQQKGLVLNCLLFLSL